MDCFESTQLFYSAQNWWEHGCCGGITMQQSDWINGLRLNVWVARAEGVVTIEVYVVIGITW